MTNYRHFPTHFEQTDEPHIPYPAEWCPVKRKWIQDSRRLRDVKASKAFVWPKDGKNGTAWGRLKDIFSNSGPDMYLTMSADKHDHFHNRPTRELWSAHPHLGGLGNNHAFPMNSRKYAPWTGKGVLGGRMRGLSYDFRTRKYEVPHMSMWTDARWQPDPKKNKQNTYPEAIRDMDGEWFQDSHYLPQLLGGPVHNERGRGKFGLYEGAARRAWRV